MLALANKLRTALPHPELISNIDVCSIENTVRFTYYCRLFEVSTDLQVRPIHAYDEVIAVLIEALLKK
ncbi:MAG: hypothetical protein A2820_03510 [Candidatus Buchananbacteria bacterium RIFCSPHIGHO2_01_FULL_40_35]|nr:MAG: hypothetical protein A2820_03510 [Candidatus Buchananbacteria bacterium RIFCSPHIGHO2_01_FULL_40_35]